MTTVVPLGPVLVNGASIGTEQVLRSGDVVQVGATTIAYEERAAR